MPERLVGLRRARRIKRVLFISVVFAGVLCVWQISRRDTEVIEVNESGAPGHQGRQRVHVTGIIHTVAPASNARDGLEDDRNRTSENPPNVETRVSDGVSTKSLNVTSRPGIAGNDAGADTDARVEERVNDTSSPNEEESIEKSPDNERNSDLNGKKDDVIETSQKANAKDSPNQNNGKDATTGPSDQPKIAASDEKKERETDVTKKTKATQRPGKPEDGAANDNVEGDLPNEKETAVASSLPRFSYSEPRYSTSENGQFMFLKFVERNAHTSSFSQSLKYSPFSNTDKVYLTLLSQGEIREIYSIAYHEKLRLVAFDAPTVFDDVIPIESCPLCGAIKSPKDLNEILAFHVDRTMAINRALPSTGRRFVQGEMENLGFDKTAAEEVFPVTWFAKDLIHQGKFQNDQNSMQLSWKDYQDILTHCHGNSSHVVDCTEVKYSDWSRMAVLDFVMQNHDRLDRYCCGYDRDEGESCFKNEIAKELDSCGDTDKRFLVHILTSKSNPKELVLLDNVGNIDRSLEHLNYELLKGIRTIPKSIMEKIYSEDFKDRLLRSLRWDTVFWNSKEEEAIQTMVDTIALRVEKLKSYIKENDIIAT